MSEKFVYTTEAGEKIELTPQNKAANPGFLRKNRALVKDNDQELVWLMIEKAADEENLAKIDELGMDEFSAFAEAWGEGVEPGESSKQ